MRVRGSGQVRADGSGARSARRGQWARAAAPPRGCTRGCALAAPLPIASLRRVEVRAAERTERGETAPERGSGTGRAGTPRFKRKRFQTHVLTCAVKTICHGVCKFRVQPQDRRWSCTSMSGCPPAHPPAAKTTRRICAITLLSLALVTTRRLSGLATSAGHTTRRGRAALHSRGVGARVPTPHRRRPCRPHRRRPCRPWLVAPSP